MLKTPFHCTRVITRIRNRDYLLLYEKHRYMAGSCRHKGDAGADMDSGGGRGVAAGAGPASALEGDSERGSYNQADRGAPSSCGAPEHRPSPSSSRVLVRAGVCAGAYKVPLGVGMYMSTRSGIGSESAGGPRPLRTVSGPPAGPGSSGPLPRGWDVIAHLRSDTEDR